VAAHSENFFDPSLHRFDTDQRCDRQRTDGRTDAQTMAKTREALHQERHLRGGTGEDCCHEMSHFKAKNLPNLISTGAPLQTPLGKLTALPQTP